MMIEVAADKRDKGHSIHRRSVYDGHGERRRQTPRRTRAAHRIEGL